MNGTDHRGVSTTVVLVTTVATVGGRTTNARKRRIVGDVEGAPASWFVEVGAGAPGAAAP